MDHFAHAPLDPGSRLSSAYSQQDVHPIERTYLEVPKMSHLNYFNDPGVGDNNRKNFRYSQAVRIGDKIECSGQAMLLSDLPARSGLTYGRSNGSTSIMPS